MDIKKWNQIWTKYQLILKDKTLGDLQKMQESGLWDALQHGIYMTEKSYD